MLDIHASMDSTMDIHVPSSDIRADKAWILGPGVASRKYLVNDRGNNWFSV